MTKSLSPGARILRASSADWRPQQARQAVETVGFRPPETIQFPAHGLAELRPRSPVQPQMIPGGTQMDIRSSPSPGDKHAYIRNHSFFKGLDERIINEIAARAVTRNLKKNTVVFRKGDAGTTFYIVSAGAVRVSAPSEQGKDAVFNLIVPGEIFGEIAFLDGGQRTADAVMAEGGTLIAVERRDFMPLIKSHPELAVRLLEILCSRLRKTSEQVEDMMFFDVSIRLAKAVLHLYRRADVNHAGAAIPIHITQRELSQMIGASRESTNYELRNWQRRGWLKLERAGLTVLAPDALMKLILNGTA
jgi:CRP/FNR family cyclic AMP-dependent transcriptional regulator